MSENVGELNYSEKERLNIGADFKNELINGFNAGGKIELNIIEDVKDEDNEEDIDKITLEARFVANKIKSLINSDEEYRVFAKNPETGEMEYRKARYKDIVILLRSTKNISDIFEEELSLNGIPCFSDTGGGYFETVEIKTIVSLLKVIDNPYQDIPLLAVLKSPIFSFTSEDLIDLRLSNDGYFYDCLKTLASEESEIGYKCLNVLNKVDAWQIKAKNTPIDEFLWYLYEDTKYFAYLGVMPNSHQRQANLKVLFERAREFMATSFKGIFSFINFIDKLKVSSGDMSGAKTLGENEDVVRIMSIHKSKGLEFPICICSGFGRKFNQQDFRESILLHQKLGFGPDIVDLSKRIKYKSSIKEAIKTKLQIEAKSEEMRILYVAFTRAKDNLIIIKRNASFQSGNYPSYLNTMLDIEIQELGEIEIQTNDTHLPQKESFQALMEFEKIPLQDIERKENTSSDEIYFGNAFHFFMQNLKLPQGENFDILCQKVSGKFRHFLNHDDFERLFKRIKNLLANAQFQKLIENKKLLKEQALSFQGEIKQLDLLALGEDEAIIIDYKTGLNFNKHKEQVLLYKEAIEKILAKKSTQAFLVYVLEDKVEIIEI